MNIWTRDRSDGNDKTRSDQPAAGARIRFEAWVDVDTAEPRLASSVAQRRLRGASRL